MDSTISEILKAHYGGTFAKYGPTSSGVDWGENVSRAILRYEKMSNVCKDYAQKVSILDIGCGYGGLLDYFLGHNIDIDYTGIDIVPEMINWAQNNFGHVGSFFNIDFMSNFDSTLLLDKKFDYVVCNGILTQKLDASNLDMDKYAQGLVKKMFDYAEHGIAFNLMSTKVNYFANNLYYRNPFEFMSWCATEITDSFAVDHTYLYEYTLYLYKNKQL